MEGFALGDGLVVVGEKWSVPSANDRDVGQSSTPSPLHTPPNPGGWDHHQPRHPGPRRAPREDGDGAEDPHQGVKECGGAEDPRVKECGSQNLLGLPLSLFAHRLTTRRLNIPLPTSPPSPQVCNMVGKPCILTRVVDTMVTTPR